MKFLTESNMLSPVYLVNTLYASNVGIILKLKSARFAKKILWLYIKK